MNKHKNPEQSLKAKQRMILEMINASWELAEQLGKHPLKSGCNCVACVNKRKRFAEERKREWKFKL